ncbi:MAG: hypothetical protein C4312_02305, partial [Thermoflexus sp.]
MAQVHRWIVAERRLEFPFVGLTLAALLGGLLARSWAPGLEGFFWLAAYLSGGFYGALDGSLALREGRLDVNLLMLLSALGAAGIGHAEEGATLLFLFSLSNALQSMALERTRRAIRRLLDLRPAMARRLREGQEEWIPVEQVRVGDRLLIRPGERIPADGVVRAGVSAVDESLLTGESMPVPKGPGAPVFAGTLNGHGALAAGGRHDARPDHPVGGDGPGPAGPHPAGHRSVRAGICLGRDGRGGLDLADRPGAGPAFRAGLLPVHDVAGGGLAVRPGHQHPRGLPV